MGAKPKTRRLPDTYNAEVIRSMLNQHRSVVNLDQFEFLQGATEEQLRPIGQGVRNRDTRKNAPVTRDARRYRGG